MNKIKIIYAMNFAFIVTVSCNTKKKIARSEDLNKQVKQEIQYSYSKDIAPMLTASCTPCHYPPNGRKEPLDSYVAVKKHIGSIIERVKLPKSDNSFMPFMNKKPALSDSAINVLISWQKNGMAE